MEDHTFSLDLMTRGTNESCLLRGRPELIPEGRQPGEKKKHVASQENVKYSGKLNIVGKQELRVCTSKKWERRPERWNRKHLKSYAKGLDFIQKEIESTWK